MTIVERETVRECVPVTTADVLNRAADLLESGEWGWCQGGARIGDGLCMLGAVAAAVGRVPAGKGIDLDHDARYVAAREALAANNSGLGTWNDVLGRTKAEVVARLREAARNAA